jgi:hypothetical protein
MTGHSAIKVVDARDPTGSRLVSTIPFPPNSRSAENKVQSISTAYFDGQLLAGTLERCAFAGVPPGPQGVMLWDVTDPVSPTHLATFDTGAGVHTLWLFQRGSNAYVLLALPGAERAYLDTGGQRGGPEFRILDVTNPRAPVQVGSWSATEQLGTNPRHGFGSNPSTNLHEVAASPDGTIAFLSWWDAGVILLDITQPPTPTVISRPKYPTLEGNTHTAVSSQDGRLMLVADEDFDPTDSRLEITSPPTMTGFVDGAQAGWFNAELLMAAGPLEGSMAYVGRGCPGSALPPPGEDDPYLGDPSGKIALIDRGDCSLTDKVARAQAAGAIGVLIANNTPYPPSGVSVSSGGGVTITIASMMVDQATADRIKATLSGGAEVRVRMHGLPGAWGSAWLFDITDPSTPTYLSELTTTHSVAFPVPADGTYSAHQPLLVDERAYLAWYSDGLRMFDVEDPRRPREIGYFVPPQPPDAGPQATAFVWGIAVDGDEVYISDYATGLWVLSRHTASAVPPVFLPLVRARD